MTGKVWRLLRVAGGAAAILSVGFVLGLPFSSRAQQPAQPAPTAAMPPGDNYVGAETCKGCHEEAFNKFSHTRMGRLFLKQARNAAGGATPARAATGRARSTWMRAAARARGA